MTNARPRISFEFFPPKTEDAASKLWQVADALSRYEPDFVSVTYGAGGSTRDKTLGTLDHLVRTTGLPCAGHLTCVDHQKSAVDAVIKQYASIGIKHIVALRGDPCAGAGEAYTPTEGGYQTTADLVSAIKRLGDFEVSVSAYPEKHPESPTVEADLDILAAKVDAGATRALTQFFFDNDAFLNYRDRVASRGINVTVVPGIMPIGNIVQISRFAKACGASIPDHVAKRFVALPDDKRARAAEAVKFASEQILDLQNKGIDEFHLYTMNRADLAGAICDRVGFGPDFNGAAVAA
ncbi:MAG: methylenetetrahydrofolate reductase [NAD(P)H] [Pseudomonadota bacterium]